MVTDCFLCRSGNGRSNIPWQDRPLWLDPRAGLVVPATGGLSIGYVLVAPLEHHLSLRQAVAMMGCSLLDFISDVFLYLQERLGEITFWEHGSPLEKDRPRAACVEHAHIHVAAGRWPLPLPPQGEAFPNLREALTATQETLSEDGYLLLGWTDGKVYVGADIMISQYYRREWAILIGDPDRWDYLIAENPGITAATIQLLLPHLEPEV
jgi:hypothetical protein